MDNNILLVRTYIPVGIGGPIPPLELLYVASQIEKEFGDYYSLKITDMGIGNLSELDIKQEIESLNPKFILLYAMAWEAEPVHTIASLAKDYNEDTKVIVFGQLATLAKTYLATDTNIDFVIIGEPELTVKELLSSLENQLDCSKVNGLIYKIDETMITTKERILPNDLDDISISSSSWDLIDVKAYARYANWNGALKESFYLPLLTSRGCPFPCTFCLETYDKQFRARSPQNVIAEIKFLQDKYKAKEIHIFDAVFNYHNQRAKDICQAIIDSDIKISLAFPHGIRADIMTDDLIRLLKEAGTYKLVYGVESGSPRIQKLIKKNLNLPLVREVIRKTAKTGILTGGYFMLGFATETEEEMNQTIDFAVDSDLDIASFFKATEYNDILDIYQNKLNGDKKGGALNLDFQDISYYSVKRSMAKVSSGELNKIIFKAQSKFYLNPKRMMRGFWKYPSKFNYLKNILNAAGLMLQAYLIQNLQRDGNGKNLSLGKTS